jgi:hypothetical protein
MHPFAQLAQTQSVAPALLVLAAVALSGLALGSLKFRGIGLGTLPDVTPGRSALPGLAYAVADPVGIAGIIGSMLLRILTARMLAVLLGG